MYFIYGIYECLNVAVEEEGKAGCVLIRALKPLCGIEIMRARRNWHGPEWALANGPGKLTRALDITRRHYGVRLDRGELVLRRWRKPPEIPVERTPRIGINQCRDWPLRFVWAGHSCLSRKSV